MTNPYPEDLLARNVDQSILHSNLQMVPQPINSVTYQHPQIQVQQQQQQNFNSQSRNTRPTTQIHAVQVPTLARNHLQIIGIHLKDIAKIDDYFTRLHDDFLMSYATTGPQDRQTRLNAIFSRLSLLVEHGRITEQVYNLFRDKYLTYVDVHTKQRMVQPQAQHRPPIQQQYRPAYNGGQMPRATTHYPESHQLNPTMTYVSSDQRYTMANHHVITTAPQHMNRQNSVNSQQFRQAHSPGIHHPNTIISQPQQVSVAGPSRPQSTLQIPANVPHISPISSLSSAVSSSSGVRLVHQANPYQGQPTVKQEPVTTTAAPFPVVLHPQRSVSAAPPPPVKLDISSDLMEKRLTLMNRPGSVDTSAAVVLCDALRCRMKQLVTRITMASSHRHTLPTTMQRNYEVISRPKQRLQLMDALDNDVSVTQAVNKIMGSVSALQSAHEGGKGASGAEMTAISALGGLSAPPSAATSNAVPTAMYARDDLATVRVQKKDLVFVFRNDLHLCNSGILAALMNPLEDTAKNAAPVTRS